MSFIGPTSKELSGTNPASSGPFAPSGLANEGRQSSLPAVTQPKGGGAIRGIGEKFSVSGPTGTATASIPIPATPSRMGFGPELALSYNSGSGNGEFGFGWQLNLPSIVRKTDKGLPRYHDEECSDIFIFSGVEDLVPVLRRTQDGQWCRTEPLERTIGTDVFCISEYKPRIEGLFSRIERWTNTRSKNSHWRIITSDNVTSLYGETSDSRIFDPSEPERVFGWLLNQKFDDRGNVIHYQYKSENSELVDLHQTHERYRSEAGRTVARYPKRIKYGNQRPRHYDVSLRNTQWMFEVVFDYGEHDRDHPTAVECRPWDVRPDPYSTYRAGFEIRTYRRCSRILMFHHFPEEKEIGHEYLVSSLDLTYQANSEEGAKNMYIASLLTSAIRCGYIKDDSGKYLCQSLPPLEFEYSRAEMSREVKDVECDSLENLPLGVDGASYQWLDLNSEGLPGVLSQQAGAYFYKPNLGNGRLGPTKALPINPSLSMGKVGRQEWLDLAGNGRLDLVQFDKSYPGFYKRAWDVADRWDIHRTFTSLPNVPWNSPGLRLVDLTGDGRADVLIIDDDVFTYFPSWGEAGFGEGKCQRSSLNEDLGPRLLFSDSIESVYLADMSGDGLSDLLRVRNGESCYWPNLGYGRFGSKVAMDNTPCFDLMDIFRQHRIRFADIDGSGTTDLIYLHEKQPLVFFNQAGNKWSSAHHVHAFPHYADASNVQVIDLLGRGTGCLVWSSKMAGDAERRIRYIDLLTNGKPYLLTSMKNNFGSETHIEYSSSTNFYLKDNAVGRPWLTCLPFPVQVVHRATIIDRIGSDRMTMRYRYHHGFFDPFEREYRGFGMVETWDCEDYEVSKKLHSDEGVTNYDPSFKTPPVLTKRWYDTGAYLGGVPIAPEYEDQFYHESQDSNPSLPRKTLSWTSIPQHIRSGGQHISYGYSHEEMREAYRSLKGLLLHEEVYGINETTSEIQPYQVTHSNYAIDLLQPQGPNRHAIFLTHPKESIQYHYERNRVLGPHKSKPNPRLSHQLNLSVDEFGNVLSSVSIAYGRRYDAADPRLNRRDHQKQQRALSILETYRYTNLISEPDGHRLPLSYDSSRYELINFPARDAASLVSSSQAYAICQKLGTYPHETSCGDQSHCSSAGQVCCRLLNRTKTRYRRNDLSNGLADGKLESLALIFETYDQVFTSDLLQEVYIKSKKLLPASKDSTLQDWGGYVQITSDGSYWKPSGQVFYSPGKLDSYADEALYALDHFYQPHRYRDALFKPSFDTEISICY